MKKLVKVFFVLIVVICVFGAVKAKDSMMLKSDKEMLETYTIHEYGDKGLNKDNVEINIESIKNGYVDYTVSKDGHYMYISTISEQYLQDQYRWITEY